MIIGVLYRHEIKRILRKARFGYKLRCMNGAAMRTIASDEELKRLASEEDGFIYNDFSGESSYDVESNILHRASCRTLDTANINVPKYFSGDIESAVTWLETNRGMEGSHWRRCTICSP